MQKKRHNVKRILLWEDFPFTWPLPIHHTISLTSEKKQHKIDWIKAEDNWAVNRTLPKSNQVFLPRLLAYTNTLFKVLYGKYQKVKKESTDNKKYSNFFFLILVFAKVGLFLHGIHYSSETCYTTVISVANPSHVFPLLSVFYFISEGDCSDFTTLNHVGKKVGDCTEARGDKSPVPGIGNGHVLHDDVLFYWNHHCAILH